MGFVSNRLKYFPCAVVLTFFFVCVSVSNSYHIFGYRSIKRNSQSSKLLGKDVSGCTPTGPMSGHPNETYARSINEKFETKIASLFS